MNDGAPFKVAVVTHGGLAEELVRSAATITNCGKDRLQAVSLAWSLDADEALRTLREFLEQWAGEEPVLILTDLYGSTPDRAARDLAVPGAVEVVSGVNLAMAVRLACGPPLADRSLEEVARWLTEKGRHAIRCGHAVDDGNGA